MKITIKYPNLTKYYEQQYMPRWRAHMFYVYELRNPITNLPFYIGVGKEGRKASCSRDQQHEKDAIRFQNGAKFKSANRHKFNTILSIKDKGLEVQINRLNEFITEQDAFNEEIRLISHYGRRDLGTGILTNLTGGGEGCVNQSIETRKKRSITTAGRPNPNKGKLLGPYSEERKKNQKEKTAKTREKLTQEEKITQHLNRSTAQQGNIPWNKGKTKETDNRVAQYAEAKQGKPRVDMIGKTPWNKGKKCPELGASKKGKPAHNKGIPSGKKGLSYEEIYGPEKAAKLKEQRKLKKIQFWQTKKNNINT